MANELTKKMTFDCPPEERRILDAMHKKMEATQGKVAMSAVIRAAIRKAASK